MSIKILLERFIEDNMGLIIMVVLINIAISLCLSMKFANFAWQKGYDRTPYFWLCFILGILGYCWVAALPDMALYDELIKLRDASSSNDDQKQSRGTGTVNFDHEWVCSMCGATNDAKYGQCKKCGKYRNK